MYGAYIWPMAANAARCAGSMDGTRWGGGGAVEGLWEEDERKGFADHLCI
jgi:hypothetical protein